MSDEEELARQLDMDVVVEDDLQPWVGDRASTSWRKWKIMLAIMELNCMI